MAIDEAARAAVLAVHAMLSGQPQAATEGRREPEPLSPGHDAPSQAAVALDPEALAEWEERAAILEFEGGFSRVDAERRASSELQVSQVALDKILAIPKLPKQ
ncbi:MAG: hypothetical protein CFE28_01435 [Alphaproteobacteria bacterium PA2]|nr:MAG: hypothetical protein CFE28_01435 [Alphaproteobacteria bacterium PA2]